MWTDVRSVLAEVLERRLKATGWAQVFPGFEPTFLNLATV